MIFIISRLFLYMIVQGNFVKIFYHNEILD